MFAFQCLVSRCDKTASCWLGSYPWICENVARAACILWSRDFWLGEPWFSHCASIASWLTDCSQIVVWHFVVCCFAFVLHCHTNPWGDTISSLLAFSNCLWTDQLTTGPAGFCFCSGLCCLLFGVFVFFVCFLCFLWLLFALHGDSMDYVSIQFSSLLYHIVIMFNVATALIRWICTMQLSFRLDKRPGESYLASDGKKKLSTASSLPGSCAPTGMASWQNSRTGTWWKTDPWCRSCPWVSRPLQCVNTDSRCLQWIWTWLSPDPNTRGGQPGQLFPQLSIRASQLWPSFLGCSLQLLLWSCRWPFVLFLCCSQLRWTPALARASPCFTQFCGLYPNMRLSDSKPKWFKHPMGEMIHRSNWLLMWSYHIFTGNGKNRREILRISI